MMFFLSSCSIGSLFNKSEAVNNNVDVDSRVINPAASPDTEQSMAADTNTGDEEGVAAAAAATDSDSREGMVNDELVPAVVLGGIPDDKWEEDGSLPVILYLRDSDGFIVPVTLRAVSQAAIAKLTLSKLIDETTNREELSKYGLSPTIPQGTDILGITIQNGVATVDFSGNFINYKTDTDERNMISSVVYTLTQFPSINGVKIMSSGKKLAQMRFGTDVSGVLYRANTMINADKLNVNTGKEKQDIFVFRNSDESTAYCLPLSIEYDENSDGANFAKTVELMTGVNKNGLASLLPEGTKLIGSSVSKGTITLNFSGDIRRYAGNMREQAILRQLLYTFAQYKGINNVRVYIEGNQNSVLPEGTDLSESFAVSKALNLIIE
jgi:Sporulation and spore germination.